MPGKFYAVRKGITPGIYTDWDTCKSMVDGFSGAEYKSFKTRGEAEAYLGNAGDVMQEDTSVAYAFVDGSYNPVTEVYGYGGFLVVDGERHVLQGSDDDPEMAAMHNVSGEIAGCVAAVKKALELGLSQLDIYYDYMGIEMWATGQWKRNKKGTIAYYEYMQSVKGKIAIQFVKVEGHSGVEGNEEADRLAKEAVGVL